MADDIGEALERARRTRRRIVGASSGSGERPPDNPPGDASGPESVHPSDKINEAISNYRKIKEQDPSISDDEAVRRALEQVKREKGWELSESEVDGVWIYVRGEDIASVATTDRIQKEAEEGLSADGAVRREIVRADVDERKRRREYLRSKYGRYEQVAGTEGPVGRWWSDTENPGSAIVMRGNNDIWRIAPGGVYNFGVRGTPKWMRREPGAPGGWVQETDDAKIQEALNSSPEIVDVPADFVEPARRLSPERPPGEEKRIFTRSFIQTADGVYTHVRQGGNWNEVVVGQNYGTTSDEGVEGNIVFREGRKEYDFVPKSADGTEDAAKPEGEEKSLFTRRVIQNADGEYTHILQGGKWNPIVAEQNYNTIDAGVKGNLRFLERRKEYYFVPEVTDDADKSGKKGTSLEGRNALRRAKLEKWEGRGVRGGNDREAADDAAYQAELARWNNRGPLRQAWDRLWKKQPPRAPEVAVMLRDSKYSEREKDIIRAVEKAVEKNALNIDRDAARNEVTDRWARLKEKLNLKGVGKAMLGAAILTPIVIVGLSTFGMAIPMASALVGAVGGSGIGQIIFNAIEKTGRKKTAWVARLVLGGIAGVEIGGLAHGLGFDQWISNMFSATPVSAPPGAPSAPSAPAAPAPLWDVPSQYSIPAGSETARYGLDGYLEDKIFGTKLFCNLSDPALNQFTDAMRRTLVENPDFARMWSEGAVIRGNDLVVHAGDVIRSDIFRNEAFLNALGDNIELQRKYLMPELGGQQGLDKFLHLLRLAASK